MSSQGSTRYSRLPRAAESAARCVSVRSRPARAWPLGAVSLRAPGAALEGGDLADDDDAEVGTELTQGSEDEDDDEDERRVAEEREQLVRKGAPKPAVFTRRVPFMTLLVVGALLLLLPARQMLKSAVSKRVDFGIIPHHVWRCGLNEDGVDYFTRNKPYTSLPAVGTAADCMLHCFHDGRCAAWTWGKSGSPGDVAGICYMKELEQAEWPLAKVNSGMVSGSLPCDMQSMQTGGSLFCFALMLPRSYEQTLLGLQFDSKLSLFGCDQYAIYSNEAIEVRPALITGIVDSDLKCSFGGEFGTALNLEIFLAVWKKVSADGVFKNHAWTVKVDPDSVFFPAKLRSMLPHHMPDQPKGVYLNNCRYGMHGPLEVFSKNAVLNWVAGYQSCLDHFNKVCSGSCNWGEDMFIDQCMEKVLHARRDNEWGLLSEEHCKPDKRHSLDWQSCNNGNVAFHPFKTEVSYRACVARAAAPPGTALPPPPPPPPPPPAASNLVTTEPVKTTSTTEAPAKEASTLAPAHAGAAEDNRAADDEKEGSHGAVPAVPAPTTPAPTTPAPAAQAPTAPPPAAPPPVAPAAMPAAPAAAAPVTPAATPVTPPAAPAVPVAKPGPTPPVAPTAAPVAQPRKLLHPYCPSTKKDFDLDPHGRSALSLDHIPTPEMCCAFCHGIPRCEAWVWKKDANMSQGCHRHGLRCRWRSSKRRGPVLRHLSLRRRGPLKAPLAPSSSASLWQRRGEPRGVSCGCSTAWARASSSATGSPYTATPRSKSPRASLPASSTSTSVAQGVETPTPR